MLLTDLKRLPTPTSTCSSLTVSHDSIHLRCYAKTMEVIYQPWGNARLGDCLRQALSRDWTHFRAAVAFVKQSGTRHLVPSLTAFAKRGHVDIIVGIDHHGSTAEALRDLLEAVSPRGRMIVFHNALHHTYHPKVYLFKSPHAAEVIIGSGNLTEGGLYTNYEASVRLQLDLTRSDHRTFLRSVDEALDAWSDPHSGNALLLNENILADLSTSGLVPSEAHQSFSHPTPHSSSAVAEGAQPLFASRSAPSPPPRNIQAPRTATPDDSPSRQGFVMTLQRTDTGHGQVTPGTSARSPEIFIPLKARNANPAFWQWPDAFEHSDKQSDRTDVPMRFMGEVIIVNMMCWHPKHDFRLRHPQLRDAGHVNDILCIETADPADRYDYAVAVIRSSSPDYSRWLAMCNHSVPNSQKRFGYY